MSKHVVMIALDADDPDVMLQALAHASTYLQTKPTMIPATAFPIIVDGKEVGEIGFVDVETLAQAHAFIEAVDSIESDGDALAVLGTLKRPG